MTSVSERIRNSLVGLRMPRALEAIDELLLEEYSSCEGRRMPWRCIRPGGRLSARAILSSLT